MIKNSHSFDVGPSSLAKTAFYCAKYKIQNGFFLDLLSNNYEIYKEKYNPRQSFALLLSCLKLNLTPAMTLFFVHEYKKFMDLELRGSHSNIIRTSRCMRIS